MFRFVNLILKNLGRNKLRTTLTAMAVMALVAIYAIVSVVTDRISSAVAAYSSQTRLIVREKWVQPSRFPSRYVNKIAKLDGVEEWTTWNFYVGTLGDKSQKLGGIATKIENIHRMHPGLENFDHKLIDAMAAEKTGILIGAGLMHDRGLKLGQRFTVDGVLHPGKNLEFKIVGVLHSEIWNQAFFMRQDYYEQATGEQEEVAVLWLRVRDQATGEVVAPLVQSMFEKTPTQLRVETESAGASRVSGRLKTIVNIINFVTTVLLIDMVVILSNSISMTVRERRKEMAILKVLGFQPNFIMIMVIGEAMFVGAVSGFLGTTLTYFFCWLNKAEMLPVRIAYLADFPVTADYIPMGIVLGIVVGFVGSFIPAWNARKVQVATVFSAGG